MEHEFKHILFTHTPYSDEEMIERSAQFLKTMQKRRSIRFFSDKDVPFEIIQNVIQTAGTSPSGAHQQPWSFIVVKNQELKHKIRLAAEEEEKRSYEERMTDEWLNALAPLGTDWHKPYLETAPYLIVVFRQRYGFHEDKRKKKHYYSTESVGIAVGFLIAAIHNAGLVTLTHTPNPMKFLSKILERPENEVPFVLLPVGYPSSTATVPDINRKRLDEIMIVKD